MTDFAQEAVHVRFPYFKLSGVNGPDDKGVFWLGFYEVKTFPFDPSKAAFSDLAVQICGAAKAARLRYILWITINEVKTAAVLVISPLLKACPPVPNTEYHTSSCCHGLVIRPHPKFYKHLD